MVEPVDPGIETPARRRAFATCRGCGDAFSKRHDFGRQDVANPRLCLDCASREIEFHRVGHNPGAKCVAEFMGG